LINPIVTEPNVRAVLPLNVEFQKGLVSGWAHGAGIRWHDTLVAEITKNEAKGTTPLVVTTRATEQIFVTSYLTRNDLALDSTLFSDKRVTRLAGSAGIQSTVRTDELITVENHSGSTTSSELNPVDTFVVLVTVCGVSVGSEGWL
jgi:hypothetical protein